MTVSATALAVVGLDSTLAKRRIDQLSGGQMRRVVLAGLLARSPRALILDEPLAGLDAATQRGLLRLLEELRREQELTVVVISHDFAGLEELCPRTLDLRDGVLEPAARRREVGHDRAVDVTARPAGQPGRWCCCVRCPAHRPSTSCGPAPNCWWSAAFRSY